MYIDDQWSTTHHSDILTFGISVCKDVNNSKKFSSLS